MKKRLEDLEHSNVDPDLKTEVKNYLTGSSDITKYADQVPKLQLSDDTRSSRKSAGENS